MTKRGLQKQSNLQIFLRLEKRMYPLIRKRLIACSDPSTILRPVAILHRLFVYAPVVRRILCPDQIDPSSNAGAVRLNRPGNVKQSAGQSRRLSTASASSLRCQEDLKGRGNTCIETKHVNQFALRTMQSRLDETSGRDPVSFSKSCRPIFQLRPLLQLCHKL